jgi:hypothetical protein
MGVIIPVGYALVSIHGRTSGDLEDMVTTFGVRHDTSADVTLLPSVVGTAYGTHISPNISNQHTMTLVKAKLGPNDTGVTYEEAYADVGANAEAMPPPNTSVLVRKITGLGGRRGRGRFYWPGFSVQGGSATAAGTFSSADAGIIGGAVQDFLDELLNDVVSGPFPPMLLHSDALAPTPITSVLCDTRFATQRRRLRP